MTNESERFLTVAEVAARLRVTTFTVRRYLNQGELAAYKIGQEWRIKESDLRAFIESRRVGRDG
jgi:excisionase family DNA binding protein